MARFKSEREKQQEKEAHEAWKKIGKTQCPNCGARLITRADMQPR